MASIFKRKLKEGNGFSWRAIVRLKGHPAVCESFERKQQAEDWAKETERKIKQGQFKFHQHNQQYTFSQLIERFLQDGALEHHRSKEDTLRHLSYWEKCFENYGLIYITEDFIGKQRQLLEEWISKNPGSKLLKERKLVIVARMI